MVKKCDNFEHFNKLFRVVLEEGSYVKASD